MAYILDIKTGKLVEWDGKARTYRSVRAAHQEAQEKNIKGNSKRYFVLVQVEYTF